MNIPHDHLQGPESPGWTKGGLLDHYRGFHCQLTGPANKDVAMLKKIHDNEHQEKPGMNPDDTDLLRSYANGPRIWDATAILPAVYRLAGQGLIEPAPPAENGSARSTYCYQLTDAGSQVLAAAEPSAQVG